MLYTVGRMPMGAENADWIERFDPARLPNAYAALEEANIDRYVWDTSYTPEAHARVGWNEAGLHALLYAKEETIRAQCRDIGGRVCEDSCLEWFCQPFPEADARYFNAEVNPLGTIHFGLGEGRHERVKCFGTMPQGFVVRASGHRDGWWAVAYTVPMPYLRETFGAALASGQRMRGNFYTCDESIHPHFGSWAPVRAEKPDFHRPECFQTLLLG